MKFCRFNSCMRIIKKSIRGIKMGAKRTAQRLNKLIKSMNPGKERYQKAAMANIDGREMQCFYMQYYAIGLYEPNEFVEILDDPDLIKAFQRNLTTQTPEKYTQIYFNVEDVKAAVEGYKERRTKDVPKSCIIELNNKYYDAQYVLDVISILSMTDGLFYWCQTPAWNHCDYIYSSDGVAVICPRHLGVRGHAVHIPVEIIDEVK